MLGYDALGVADLGTVGGVVHAWEGEKATGVRLIPGARVDLDDGRRLLLYPTDRPAWSRLTRRLTLRRSRAGKGGCLLDWADATAWAGGLLAILLPDEPNDANAQRLGELVELIGVPRHTSQHPGGFVLTHDRLDDLVPIEPAAMADRQIIEWDKDDIDALRFMKVDVLGLGMLGQIEGFGSYGFPERHAASFAKLAYASSWMRRHHPDVFCAALLNVQPMGFHAPAQIVRCARDHGVQVRPACINASRWDCTLEPGRGRWLVVRLGSLTTVTTSRSAAE